MLVSCINEFTGKEIWLDHIKLEKRKKIEKRKKLTGQKAKNEQQLWISKIKLI